MSGKIIGAGFQKTGTSSLREALKTLGYKVKDTSSRALIPILRGNYDRLLHMIRDYDAVEDTPWYRIYQELDRRLPGSKFILTLREEESWYTSVSRHIGLLKNANHEWIYGRGKGLPIHHRDNTIRIYREHNSQVKEYFRNRPGDLLVVDFTSGDGWEKLCPFLGLEIPDVPFPHANQWETNQSRQPYYGYHKDFKYYRKSLKNRLKIQYIDWMNWW